MALKITPALAVDEPERSKALKALDDDRESAGLRPVFPAKSPARHFEAVLGREKHDPTTSVVSPRLLPHIEKIPRKGKVFPTNKAATLLVRYGQHSRRVAVDINGKGIPVSQRVYLEEYDLDEEDSDATPPAPPNGDSAGDSGAAPAAE